MIYFILFLAVITALGVLFYWLYTDKTINYTKGQFENMSISKNSIRHHDLGLFVALVSKILKSKSSDDDSLESHLVSLMLNDISVVFPKPQMVKEILKDIIDEQKEVDDNTISIAKALGESIKKDKVKQQQFLEFLAQIVFLDEETVYESEFLITVTEAFALDSKVCNEIFKQFQKIPKIVKSKLDIEDAYKLLHVTKNSSMASIKEAYISELKKHHLNIVQKLGDSELYDETYAEYYIVKSTLKLKEIAKAYKILKYKS